MKPQTLRSSVLDDGSLILISKDYQLSSLGVQFVYPHTERGRGGRGRGRQEEEETEEKKNRERCCYVFTCGRPSKKDIKSLVGTESHSSFIS